MTTKVQSLMRSAIVVCVIGLPGVALAEHTVRLTGQNYGLSPFIKIVDANVTSPQQLTSVQFTILPKAGSVTRPISATYSAPYMIAHGYWDGTSPEMHIPVFGLYAGADNTVTMNFAFSDDVPMQLQGVLTTKPYTDSCNVLNNRTTILQARKTTQDLSFDYFLLKKNCDPTSPTIVDTDGEVRWIGTSHSSSLASILFQNQVYVSDGTGVIVMNLDGSHEKLANYKNIGVTSTRHHNFDPGRTGFIMDVNTTDQIESVNIEIDTTGKVLNTWDLSKIISKAMMAGGDDPSKFVYPAPNDWFHNNATTYDAAHNLLIVSSRENFVIALDYDTQEIKWILGDPSKHWHQYKSLTKYALKSNTVYPIGQHAVSIDPHGNLLLFDDGLGSNFQMPPGKTRTYSAPRAYRIDTTAMTATEVFNYSQRGSIYNPVCGSVYEDATNNYLIDYPSSQHFSVMEIVGLTTLKTKIFDFQYPETNVCTSGWNAAIIHLENLQF